MKITRAKSLNGTVDLPGDKSISHRAAIIAAMAEGETRIYNYSNAEDCQATLRCLEQLGVPVKRTQQGIVISGVGKKGFRSPDGPLDCGNSGTTMRLLSGILAGQNFEAALVGDGSLNKRPMLRLVAPLKQMGARVVTTKGTAPITVAGTNSLRGIEYNQQVPSAQIKSSILLAGLNASGETTVIETIPTRDHTERMLEWFGANVTVAEREGSGRISISGSSTLSARDVNVPQDISSAAFFMIGAACLDGSNISLLDVGLNPTRTAILDLLLRLGAKIEMFDRRDINNESVAFLGVSGGLDRKAERLIFEGQKIVAMIDEIPIIAVLGTQLDNGLEVRGAEELRFKETDRIAAIVENLKRMNAIVEEFPDGFRVERSELKGAIVDSFGDHRIAMAFAVAGFLADGETEITGSECADISFPRFFETLGSVIN